MKLTLYTAVVFLAISSVLAQGNFVRGRQEAGGNTKAPLDLKVVIGSVADHLWNKDQDGSDQPTFFVITGSYPAALLALEQEPPLLLPYNNIDILLPRTDPACKPGSLRVSYNDTMIPNQPVNLIEECWLSQNDVNPKNIHGAGDTDGVGVAITVDTSRRIVLSWDISEEFQEFLYTK